jgi:hypothetical protein
MAYHVVRMIVNRDSFSTKFFAIFAAFFVIVTVLGGINMQTGPTTFTRREIFNTGNLILLGISYLITIAYFAFKKKVTPLHRKGLIYFYLGLLLITAIMVVPLHLLGIRFIEVFQAGYIYASIPEQILVMYGYSLAFEAAGFFLPFYVIIYHFKLIDLKQE